VETLPELLGSVESMTVSLLIVVPTLNSYVLLPQLVRSLQAQSITDWRLLFIDGPSLPDHRRWLQECCDTDSRCSWVEQEPERRGIFGAMSQGFDAAGPEDWLLFWGSDDWAASSTSLASLISAVNVEGEFPDLVVSGGRYSDAVGELGRRTVFATSVISQANTSLAWRDLNAATFRRCLFFGATPPHQGTLFGPGAVQRIRSYRKGLRLAADLDYFLRLSVCDPLRVRVLNLELVHMADAGVSGQQTLLRLHEVRQCYQRAFGAFWWFPFLFRYIRRLVSRFVKS